MSYEVPLNVEVDDGGGLDALVKDLEGMKDKIRASTRAIEDFKESIAKMKGLGLPTEQIDAAKLKLEGMEKSLRGLKRSAEDKGLELNGLKEGTKNGAEGLKGLLGLGQSFGGKLGEFSGKGAQLTEVLGKLGQGAEGAGGMLGKLGSAAAQNGGKVGIIIAVVLGLIAVLTAGIRALTDFTKHMIKASDAARTLAITAVATFQSKEDARAWAKEVERLGTTTDLSREKLQEMGLSLKKFKGDEFKSAFNAIAVSTSAIGDEGGKQVEGLLTKIKEGAESAKSTKFQFSKDAFKDTPISLEQMADALAKIKGSTAVQALKDLKNNTVEVQEALLAVSVATDTAFGGAAQEKAKSVDSLSKKLSENWDSLFSGADLKLFIHSLEKLVSLFDTSNTSGKTLKDTFSSISEIFIDIASGAILTLVDIIEGIIIVGQRLYLVWLTIQLAILDVEDAIDGVVGSFNGALKSVKETLGGWYQMGADAVSGLAKGIEETIQEAINAITNVGEKIKNAFKKALGIASPSKVFMGYGEFIAEGAAEGIEDGSPDVQKSVAEMIPVAKIGKDIQNVSTTNNNSNISTPEINVTFQIMGEMTEEAKEDIRVQMVEVLQNAYASAGGDPGEV